MNPKPRNFQTALYKFTSTPAGSLPTDEDLMRVLDHGLTGSAMPRFNLVSTEEREAVIAYIKTFSERWETDERKSPVPMGDDPWLNDPVGGILEGEYLYHTIATCWQCHPGYVGLELLNEFNVDAERPALPNLPEAYFESKIRQTPDGDPILAPDFTFDYIKTGVELHTLFYRIGAGITGAAMPAWAYALDASDIWAISYYVQYLSKEHRKDIIRGEVIPFGEKHPEGIYDMVVKEEETDAELETSSADDMVDEDIEEEYEEEEEEEEE
jgi:cytochrome c oxidase cbb3-type subunit 2